MLTENFKLQEFVAPEVHRLWGQQSIQFLDFRIVQFAQLLRENIGKPIVINNWHVDGQYKESGLRDFNTRTGAKMSQHKFGRAIDVKLMDLNGVAEKDCGEFFRRHVSENWEKYKHLISTTEADTDSWAHFDCRYTGRESLNIVPRPRRG